MKHAAIVTYHDGTTTGAVVTAKDTEEAWKKLFSLFNPENIMRAEMAAILTPEREGRRK